MDPQKFLCGPWGSMDPRLGTTGLLPNHANGDIGLLDAQQWLQRLTFDGYCDEQLYSVHPLPSCTTTSINALFNKSVNHSHI